MLKDKMLKDKPLEPNKFSELPTVLQISSCLK